MGARHLHAVTDPYQPDDSSDQAVPHDVDAERAVIGAVLLGRSGRARRDQRTDRARRHDVPAHETILAALCSLADRRKPTNALGPSLKRIGAPAYLHGSGLHLREWALRPQDRA